VTTAPDLPSLEELGLDLLRVPLWRRVLSLITPFVLVIAFFPLAARGWWLPALACPVLLSFFTYGSISHDLVHRTLGLSRWLNELLLSAIELIAIRSGHAYRLSHLHHHAHFPDDSDIETASARMPLPRALFDGITMQWRLWSWAAAQPCGQRSWIIGEGIAVALVLLATLVSLAWTPLLAIYVGLMIAGSWTIPIITVLIPHDSQGATVLTQTRLFRGKVLSVIALEHLYHLEHHLFPRVPHHNWPALARRLDPHFARLGLEPIRLLF
jgi:beta-carotene hydroxylase